MKIIFLDIDGVINSVMFFGKTIKEAKKKYRKDVKKGLITGIAYHRSQIDPKSIKQLNDLMAATGADVVISSSWRTGNSIEYLQELFKKQGFKGTIVGKTADFDEYPDPKRKRGYEIECFVQEHNIQKYVILDDAEDMTDYQKLNHFVCVDGWVGITPNVVDKAIKILNNE
jgi:HAD domain in Swiss Army Knife RNA repair proteins